MVGTVKLTGGATYDYVIIAKSEYDIDEVTFEDPSWDIDTQFRVSFTNETNPLIAGNSMSGDNPPTEYDVYRSKNGEDLVLAGTVDAANPIFNDYAVCNNTDYSYTIYPSDSSDYVGTAITLHDPIRTKWCAWYLLVCDETEEKNSFVVDEIYIFEFDLNDIQMTNNTTANKIVTFSRYPRVQKDLVNAFSGTLNALIGKINCAGDHYYYETTDMTDAVRELSTDIRPKFLRDMEGHLYHVEVCSPISINQKYFLNSYKTEKSLEWIEIAPLNNAKITGDII